MKKDPILSIGSIAKRTGCSVSAIRYYDEQKLLPSIRSPSGHRLFHRSVIRRVSFILIAQNLGYSLNQIKAALQALPENRTPTRADWKELSRIFNTHIDEKITQLQMLKESLLGCMGCGCLSLQRCRLYNPNDQIRNRGAGPRYLLGDGFADV